MSEKSFFFNIFFFFFGSQNPEILIFTVSDFEIITGSRPFYVVLLCKTYFISQFKQFNDEYTQYGH